MHLKEIKFEVKKQIKKNYPDWKKLSKGQKRKIAKNVLNKIVESYNFKQPCKNQINELLGIENQVIDNKIVSLTEMEKIISENKSDTLLNFIDHNGRKPCLANNELAFIDTLLDNQIINCLLAYDGYSPCMRDIHLHHLLRAELLKAIKYPEISYRKFCTREYMGMHQKENKAFIGLPLHKNQMIDHSMLSKFRNGLTFAQMVNILVYVLHHFQKLGFLDQGLMHGIDSTDLAVTNQTLLASVKIGKQKVRIYADLDCDCGKRRNKRDKSSYVVGYRMHTLTAINPENGHNYPLISLLAPANHHDSHFAHPLISLAQAIGLDVKLVTADEAYHDKQGEIYKDTGACIITPANSKTEIPEYVDLESKQVFCNKNCLVPMQYLGVTEQEHEYKCNANLGECLFADSCPQYRNIPIDSGYFQRINLFNEHAEDAINIRKHSERPFNLLKNREGLNETRARSQQGILARCTIAQMATLLITMAETRQKEKPRKKQAQQLSLPLAA